MNGEQVTKIILDRLDRIEDTLAQIADKVDKINSHGCAHRTNDLLRIQNLESWRDRGVFAVIALAISVVIEYLLSHAR